MGEEGQNPPRKIRIPHQGHIYPQKGQISPGKSESPTHSLSHDLFVVSGLTQPCPLPLTMCPPTGGRGVSVGPILSSSASDIFCDNENGPNFLFHNRGDGTFVDTAASAGEYGPTPLLPTPDHSAPSCPLPQAQGQGCIH